MDINESPEKFHDIQIINTIHDPRLPIEFHDGDMSNICISKNGNIKSEEELVLKSL